MERPEKLAWIKIKFRYSFIDSFTASRVPIVNAADVGGPEEFVDVAAEIKKIQRDLKRRRETIPYCAINKECS